MRYYRTIKNEIFPDWTPEIISLEEDQVSILWFENGRMMTFSPKPTSNWAQFLIGLTSDGRSTEILDDEVSEIIDQFLKDE